MWRIDLTDLRLMSSPPAGRFENKIDVDRGIRQAFPLLRSAAAGRSGRRIPSTPSTTGRSVISLGFNIAGKPAVGVAFGTGDRDDITSTLEPLALTFQQRYYYVVDRSNTTTLTESDLLEHRLADRGGGHDGSGERLVPPAPARRADQRRRSGVGGVIFFPTFNPLAALSGTNPCAQRARVRLANGTARLYRVFYSTGNPYLGADRGETQTLGGFLSEPVYFQSQDQQGNIIFTTENTVRKRTRPERRRPPSRAGKSARGDPSRERRFGGVQGRREPPLSFSSPSPLRGEGRGEGPSPAARPTRSRRSFSASDPGSASERGSPPASTSTSSSSLIHSIACSIVELARLRSSATAMSDVGRAHVRQLLLAARLDDDVGLP